MYFGSKEAATGRQRHEAEQIISNLREAEVLQGKGMSVEEVLRQLGISDATYYKWRKEYGGLRVDQAKRLKELEQENSRLRLQNHACLEPEANRGQVRGKRWGVIEEFLSKTKNPHRLVP